MAKPDYYQIKKETGLSMKWARFYKGARGVFAVLFWLGNVALWAVLSQVAVLGPSDPSGRTVTAKIIVSLLMVVLEIVVCVMLKPGSAAGFKLNTAFLFIESIAGIFVFGVSDFAFEPGYTPAFVGSTPYNLAGISLPNPLMLVDEGQSWLRLIIFAVLSALWLALNKIYFDKREQVYTGKPHRKGQAS